MWTDHTAAATSVTPLSIDAAILEKPLGENSPIARYAHTLGRLRSRSRDIQTPRDEILFARTFHDELKNLAAGLNLPPEHFQIDTSGDPLEVTEGRGRHLICPTHFENGAYFSHPHADHQLDYAPEELPKIQIGKYVRFGKGAGVNAGADVVIGDGAWLSPGSLLLRQDHDAYGRPSVGARTVAMSTLPPITLAEFAWVGRDAMVGWNCDYIGRCSIVATRAFTNTWIGDYSIAGDRGRILQYQPFKAHFMEEFNPSIETLLQIDAWDEIDANWRAAYAMMRDGLERKDLTDGITALAGEQAQRSNILVINASHSSYFDVFKDQTVDIISESRTLWAPFLQYTIDKRMTNIRLRSQPDLSSLPFPTGGNFHYRRAVGYHLVIVDPSTDPHHSPSVDELLRVVRPGGAVLVSADLLTGTHEISKTGRIGSQDFALVRKPHEPS